MAVVALRGGRGGRELARAQVAMAALLLLLLLHRVAAGGGDQVYESGCSAADHAHAAISLDSIIISFFPTVI